MKISENDTSYCGTSVIMCVADREEGERMERTVIVIPADRTGNTSSDGNIRKCRVAAYCRVSTDNEKQLTSYHNQIAHYVNMISENEEWEYVDIYADEGITGTKDWKRDEFNRLLDDCRKGLIDLILVKSVSRFARNTVDCLKYVRELRNLHVDVYFENQNIHSIRASSDFLLTMHAMHAQEQSVSVSGNQKWSVRNRMKEGTWLPCNIGYGYIVKDGEIIKDKEAGFAIELIKDLYIDGYSINKIRSELEKRKISSPKGNNVWSERAITNILFDPLYRGHLIAQKTYATETFPFERRWNNGELPKYFYQNDHEPYIYKEEAEKIDHIIMMRRTRTGVMNRTNSSASRNGFSSKIICHDCKGNMKRIIKTSPRGSIGYSCTTHIRDKQKCSNKTVMEETIHKAFIVMVNKLKYHEDLLDDYLKDLEVLDKYTKSYSASNQIKQKYQNIKKQIYEIAMKFNRGLCESAFYVQEIKRLRTEADILYKKLKTMRSEVGYFREIEETHNIKRTLRYTEYLSEFDEVLFATIIDFVEAYDQNILIFHLCNGLEVKEEVQT